MPIDKSQSAQGLRYVEIYGSIRQCGPDIPVQDWESESGWLGWSTECDPSCQNHPWKKDERHDYEVDSEGRLIRLGNQIEEELFSAHDLEYHTVGSRGVTARVAGFMSVAWYQSQDFFSHWADTPRNRELGLFKDERSTELVSPIQPSLDVGAIWVSVPEAEPVMNVDGKIIKTCPDCGEDWLDPPDYRHIDQFALGEQIRPRQEIEYYLPMDDCLKLSYQFLADMSDIVLEISHTLQDDGTAPMKCEYSPLCVETSDNGPFLRTVDLLCKYVKFVVFNRSNMTAEFSLRTVRYGVVTEKEGEEIMSDKEFKPFTNSDFREAIRGHENEKDVYFVVSVRQWDMRCDKETNNDGHTTVIGYKLKHDCGSDRSVGINDIVVCTPDREICTYHRGCTEKEYSYQATPLTDEQLRKVSSDLDAELHKKMVETQNRSLAAAEVFEETSWIKAKLPDGRIIESPLPKVKDGWEETWSDRWQEGECTEMYYYPVNEGEWHTLRDVEGVQLDSDVHNVLNQPRLPMGDEMKCWMNDMSHLITRPKIIDSVTLRRSSILEAKKFRRKKPTKDSRGTWADTGDREDSFLIHMQREFKAKRYRTDDWPERHVSGPLKWEK